MLVALLDGSFATIVSIVRDIIFFVFGTGTLSLCLDLRNKNY